MEIVARKEPVVVFVTPPVTKPSEPNVSGLAAARLLQIMGVEASAVDASIGWYRHTLQAAPLRARIDAADPDISTRRSLERHVASVTDAPPTLRRPEVYATRKLYSSAIAHLDGALKLASTAHTGVRLHVADVEFSGLRLESRDALRAVAERPGPFDAYYEEILIPELRARGATHVGVSLTFQNQSAAAARLGYLLAHHLPEVRRLLGGPLVACWNDTGQSLSGGFFDLFHEVSPGHDADVLALAAKLGKPAGALPSGPRTLSLDAVPWDAYLSPVPIVPLALGRGCYWAKCTFCPDYIYARHRACPPDTLESVIEAVCERFPGGAMLHLTDAALPPKHLDHIAKAIVEMGAPLKWHGFVRPERKFTDPAFVERMAAGGCAMLQVGIESAAPRLLDMMEKGVDLECMKEMLRRTRAVGIRNQIYLLFGMPTETDLEREQTLEMVEDCEDAISDVNLSILNLPRKSPMQERPADFGITEILPFGEATDLSLYDDFRCGDRHPRLEARRWIAARMEKSPAVKAITGGLRAPFKANHACFLPHR